MSTHVARTIDLLALSYAFGGIAWFFFVQAPVLVRRLGRDRSVPLLMGLAPALFRSTTVALLVMFGASFAVAGTLHAWPVVTAALALIGSAANAFVVLPRALRTGGRSLRETQDVETQKSVANFVSQGAGEASRGWHRAVVLFVVVTLAGLLPHAVALAAPGEEPRHDAPHAVVTAHAAGHGDDHDSAPAGIAEAETFTIALDGGRKWKANPETIRGVHDLLALAQDVPATGTARPASLDDTVRRMEAAYEGIFRDCTMTGAAHERLHDFLLPIGPLLARLADPKAGDPAVTLRELQRHLRRFDTFFE